MPSVLIADDAAFMRMMLKNVLTEAGYEVVGEAENGAVAVAKYRELEPGPDDDGHHDARDGRPGRPQGDPRRPIRAARVVMCSAMGQQSMVIESIQAGAKDFIVKPFQPDRVLEAVQKALA